MIMYTDLVLSKCNQGFLFTRYIITKDGDIALHYRDRDPQIAYKDRPDTWNFTKNLGVLYIKDPIKRQFKVKLYSGKVVYEDLLASLFVRSFMGYNFNPSKHYSGDINIDSLLVNNINLKKPLEIRNNKLSTKQEQIFYDKWVSLTQDRDKLSVLHGKYYHKWCTLAVINNNLIDAEYKKQYRDKFLFYYRGITHKLNRARDGIKSEVFVAANNERYYFIDFFIPTINLGVEIDGYHHYYNDDTLFNDTLRTKHIKEIRDITIFRFPNNDVMSLTLDQLFELLDICYDKAAKLATLAISALEDPKFNGIAKIAKSVLNGLSAASLPDYSSKHVLESLRRQFNEY